MVFRNLRVWGLVAGIAAVSGCAQGPVPSDLIYDPLEDANRSIHAVNKALDSALLKPASETYGAVMPRPVQRAINNSADNLGLPGQAVNHVLQGDIESALVTGLRFAINSTLGLAGLFDPASQAGLFERPTDFGETLYTYGFAEGPYLELPLLGPSTMRDTVGTAVDFAIDPMRQVIPSPEREYLFLLKGLNMVGERNEYADLLDVLLYESSDSYAAQRLSYLQNRRYTLQGETAIEELEDPFAFDY